MSARPHLVPACIAGIILCSTFVFGQPVILVGGGSLDAVEAEVQGGFVLVTFADGHSQAYLTEDVDLEASGLLPQASAGPAEVARPMTLTRVQRRSENLARVVITDADVAHISTDSMEVVVNAPEPGKPAPLPKGAGVDLAVSGLRHQVSAGLLTVTGLVRNDGKEPITGLSLQAEAVNGAGEAAGTGTTDIPGELASGRSVSFSMEFPVRGAVTDVKVDAGALLLASARPSGSQQWGTAARRVGS